MDMLNDDALAKVTGGMGQDSDDTMDDTIMAHCPNCCKDDDLTKFIVNKEDGTAHCPNCGYSIKILKVRLG